MTPETKFKSWLVAKLRDEGAFVQTIETTTGRGVPDLAVLYRGRTIWLELKASKGSCIIRPEQYVWHRKAHTAAGIHVRTLQYELNSETVRVFSTCNPSKQAKGWKLTDIVWSFPKKEFKGHLHKWLQ
jgi:hypothetical protein